MPISFSTIMQRKAHTMMCHQLYYSWCEKEERNEPIKNYWCEIKDLVEYMDSNPKWFDIAIKPIMMTEDYNFLKVIGI